MIDLPHSELADSPFGGVPATGPYRMCGAVEAGIRDGDRHPRPWRAADVGWRVHSRLVPRQGSRRLDGDERKARVKA